MSDLDGVFDTIQNEERDVEVPAAQEKTETSETETNTEESESTTESTPKQKEEVESTESTVEAKTETEQTTETTESEPSQTETNTDADVSDWKAKLPPPPVPIPVKQPEYDAEGNIVNMTPQDYEAYLIGKAQNQLSQQMYSNFIENAAFDNAEKILPEMKTNPKIREMVMAMRIIGGDGGDTVAAAQAVKDALGISSEKLTAAKAQGAQSAKSSITIQKNAALETNGASTKKETSKSSDLVKRAQRGDEDALATLIGDWDEAGKLD